MLVRPALVVCLLTLLGAPASADRGGDARAHYQKATAHFAVGEFAEAAAEYQTAFKLRPEGALLYNAAQAHRLAGNLDKAMVLYRNYVQLYPDASNIGEIRAQIEKLKRAIAANNSAVTSPPTGTTKPADEKSTGTVAAKAPEPEAKPAAPATAPEIVAQTPSERKTPVYKKWWLWTIVGAVAAGGAITAAVLVTTPRPAWENHAEIGPGSATGALVVQW
jgi:tetratricopeptide (TPR) repeat protein